MTEEKQTNMDFLDRIDKEERDNELDEQMGEGRKRKREDGERTGRASGLGGLPGWERRSRSTRTSGKWSRKVVSWEVNEEGKEVRCEKMEDIVVPEGYELGREEKGLDMNNSGRLKNNFGLNREALFPAGQGRKSEMRNWLASFTKTGCVSCRDENGKLNHKGRDGQPNVLIVGDEAVPSTVGFTRADRNGGKGDSCVWMMKVEFLGLDEVGDILRKINSEKRAADRVNGKREHDFFLANGSKILVSSYVHLRKEGLEGYISDFNTMIKTVQGIVGKAEIEVLPVVPVVHEGVDLVGRELLSMLHERVEWVGVVSGRESVRRLSGTGGRESESGGRETAFIWKPSFQMKDGKTGALRLVVGERTETVVRAATRTNEMAKLMGCENKRVEGSVQESEEMEKMMSEKNGGSVEGEFVFSRAVGEFLKEEVRAGSFKGNYMLNLKEQIKMRCRRENGGDKRVRILLVGASQIGRIGAELVRSHGEKVRVIGRVRMSTEHTDLEHGKIVEEVRNQKGKIDTVVIGGPGSSLVQHGKEGERGFEGERQVRIVKNRDGEDEWQVTYHMTDPVKIPMTEKVELVDGMVDMMTEVKRAVGDMVSVFHVTMFPRFVEQCCRDHMTDEDVWLLDGIRRDVNREIKETMCERDSGVEVVDWWQMVNARNEMTLGELRRAGVVDGDNVHLTARSNRIAAASLMYRLLEKGGVESCKRRRLE
jgi:hypothetical protein